ncbi:DnaJ-domain-containing protein [Xylaria cf. heliscus]|nr:DnaJ-domain-containing protein [Xylaria cf. heliscus]
MPARSAASLLATPAPIPRQRLRPRFRFRLFPHSSSTLSTLHRPGLFFRPAIPPQRQSQHSAPRGANPRRSFHNSVARRDDAIDNARSHYETLKIAPTASPAEIKKSFYSLSKTHHPDVHEAAARRAAAKRFMRISEAYSILSSPSKREKYDREHMFATNPNPNYSPPHTPKGSYASTGPAGGRPASGLSRRRGTFQGPPPSFFRSGGWGAQGVKRRAAHEESTGTSGMGSMGGMGPGQDPFGHRDEVPHFDKDGHQRTGRHSDRRREARQRAATTAGEHGQRVPVEPERGPVGMFFAIGGVLLLSFIGPFIVGRLWIGAGTAPKQNEKSGEKGRG